MKRDKLVAATQFMLEASEQVSLSVARARCLKKNAATRIPHWGIEPSFQSFPRLAVYGFRMRGGQFPESFKKLLEGMIARHGGERIGATSLRSFCRRHKRFPAR